MTTRHDASVDPAVAGDCSQGQEVVGTLGFLGMSHSVLTCSSSVVFLLFLDGFCV
jgi:hypothetical protein